MGVAVGAILASTIGALNWRYSFWIIALAGLRLHNLGAKMGDGTG